MFRRIASLFFVSCATLCGQMHHHTLHGTETQEDSYCWEELNVIPFDELLITWNAKRPEEGEFSIFVSVLDDDWSDWMHYADWGAKSQRGDLFELESGKARVYQDAVETLNGKKNQGFKIKVVANQGASISSMHSLHVHSCCINDIALRPFDQDVDSVEIDVPRISQMALPTPHTHRLCSPTSTSSVINFLNGDSLVAPVGFAEQCFDERFDIFGNWVLNVAEAYNQLRDSKYMCWVARLTGFGEILGQLKRGFPVVVSIKGSLEGAAMPYKSGHLIIISGYDANLREVICMDPAFPTDNETAVRYQLDDLLEAWARRKNVAYIFSKDTD